MPTNCPTCSSSIEGAPATKCDGCGVRIHFSCIGISTDEATRYTRSRNKNVKFLCNNCNARDDKFAQLKMFFANLIDTKMNALEDKINNVNKNIPPSFFEDVVSEAMERINRSHNIILCNVPEPKSTSIADRNKEDNELVEKLSKHIQGDRYVAPSSVRRIGKIANDKPRMLKVTFTSPNQARAILRNKKKLANSEMSNVYVRDDKTPKQMEYFKQVKEEYRVRMDGGERGLTIKYIRGVPTIMSLAAEN